MGDAADDLYENMLFEDDEEHSRLSHGVWVTREGKEIDICKMTTSHINNCIKMLENTDSYNQQTSDWILLFKQELKRRIQNECI